MIRSSKHILKFANKSKQEDLDKTFSLHKEIVTEYIRLILIRELPLSKLLSSK